MPLPRTRICSTFRGGDQHLRLVLADDAKLLAGLAEEGSALGVDYAGHLCRENMMIDFLQANPGFYLRDIGFHSDESLF